MLLMPLSHPWRLKSCMGHWVSRPCPTQKPSLMSCSGGYACQFIFPASVLYTQQVCLLHAFTHTVDATVQRMLV